MRFLVDECTGPYVARWLREQNHEVFSVYEEARGIDDDAILKKAYEENWILITNDKDFGEKIFRERYPHRGIIFLRLNDERSVVKIEVLRNLIENYSYRLLDNFLVVTENKVRFIVSGQR
jgi:predicted nuclease of predicted toxin-antitoxin system